MVRALAAASAHTVCGCARQHVPGTNVCFLPQGLEASGSDTCGSPEEDNEQPSGGEGPVGEWDGAIVTCF